MNRKKRDRLSIAINLLDSASDIVSGVYDDESDALENLPENLEGSDRYQKIEDCVLYLEDAVSMIDEATGMLREASQ